MRRTSPTQPSSRRRTGRRPATSSARPDQAVTSRRSSRSIRMVDASARNPRLVSSTIIRMSVSRSWEAARRPAIPRTVSRRSASSASRRGSASRPGPIDRRSTISGWASVRVGRSPPTNRRKIEPPPLAPVDEVIGTAIDGPSWTGVSSGPSRRARTSRWSHRDGAAGRPPSVPVPGRTLVPDGRRVVDRLLSVGLHSASVAGPVSTAVRPRIRGLHIPVDDGPSPIGGERAALTMKPVRPAS